MSPATCPFHVQMEGIEISDAILFEFSSSCIISCNEPLSFKLGKNGNLKRHSTFLFTPFNHAATCDPRAECSPSTIFHMQYRVYPEGKPCIVECSFIDGSTLGVSGGAACVMTRRGDGGVQTGVSGIRTTYIPRIIFDTVD